MGCRSDYINVTTGVRRIAADLLQRQSRQPWAITGQSLDLDQWLLAGVAAQPPASPLMIGPNSSQLSPLKRIICICLIG